LTKRQHKVHYGRIVSDIVRHQEFSQLKDYHHHNSSIYVHARRVSYYSYRVCRVLGLDYHAGARGGLLHDFFLYDWRSYKKDKTNPNHGRSHPTVALHNSRRCFSVSEKESDIIRHHMWPKGSKRPQSAEGVVVSLVDKYCATLEFFMHGVSFARQRYQLDREKVEDLMGRYHQDNQQTNQ